MSSNVDDDDEKNPQEQEAPLEKVPKTKGDKPCWIRPRVLLAALVLVVLVLVAVGLSVGLNLGLEDDDDKDDSRGDNDFSETQYYQAVGPLEVNLPYISSSVTQGYANCSGLRDALTEAVKFDVNSIIWNNAYNDYRYYDWTVGRGGGLAVDEEMADAPAEKTQDGNVETDYESNNQEKDVDEADVVKSDGTYVYTAYGDLLIIVEASSGREVQRIKMPSDLISTATSRSFVGCGGNQRPNIIAFLLHPESYRLVVIVGGYGPQLQSQRRRQPIFSSWGGTHLRLYDTSALFLEDPVGKVTLVATKNLKGGYQGSRSIEENAHVVTSTYINSYPYLEGPLSKWNDQFIDLNRSAYIDAAAAYAQDELISPYVDYLMEDMDLDGDCSRVSQVTLMQQGLMSDMDEITKHYQNGVLNGYAEINSFEMNASDFVSNNKTISTSVTTAFFPTSWVQIYASLSMMVLFGEGSTYNGDLGIFKERTYVMGFRFDGASTSAVAVGSSPGYLLNTFAIDHHGDYLRLATTERAQWRSVWTVDENGNEAWDNEMLTDTSNQIVILKLPDVVSASPENALVLKQVAKLGGLGHAGETIRAVRFLDNVGFVVTFRNTDPFYTIDLRDNTNPKPVGELNVTGFSNYLHPIDDDNTLILAVGQEVDPESNVQVGLQISLFDVSDLEAPTLKQRYIVEDDKDASSYSDAQWNHLAFRYLKESKKLILPVSMHSWGRKEGNFDGFVVYNISTTAIAPHFNISHVESNRWYNWCWYNAHLQARSMLFRGKLMTMKGHSVLSHNLMTGGMIWRKDLDEKNTDGCCGYMED